MAANELQARPYIMPGGQRPPLQGINVARAGGRTHADEPSEGPELHLNPCYVLT